MGESIYQFQEEDARRFVQKIGAEARRKGDELQLKECPFCHGGGGRKKDRYTFSINLKSGACNCMRASCGYTGNMITLARDFDFSLGRDTDSYFKLSAYSEKVYADFSKFRDKHAVPTDPALAYLKGRGISEAVAKKYELSTKKNDDGILVFPFRDENGNIQFVKFRNMDFQKGITHGSKEWCMKSCKPILFGMYQCESRGRLIITEGQLDSLSVTEAGIPNAVSVPTGANGFTWVPYCWDFVNTFQEIVVFGDNEKGTITLSAEISARWPDKTKVVRTEDYRGCKDANEILQQYGPDAIRTAIENATGAEDRRIKRMTEVQSIDIMAMRTLKTELGSLDSILNGGFRVGQLVVLTGRRGEGKSTLGSMIGVQALRQGFNCFFYSGELMDFYFRNWMDRQITGKELSVTDTTDADRYFLNQFYADKAYIYDNAVIDINETEDLPRTIEKAIRQKGCEFILVDNLMTAIDPGNDDLYRAQSKFVGELAALAKKYSVIILLIAHPRKTSTSIGNDDISGSADITNKADIVMTYGRDTSTEDQDLRRLSVIKNRLTGKLTKEDAPIRLIFEPKSKRIAEKRIELMKQTETFTEGFYELTQEQLDELPFS